jgi:hypothetical protein
MFGPIKEVGDVSDLGRWVKTLQAILKRVKKTPSEPIMNGCGQPQL